MNPTVQIQSSKITLFMQMRGCFFLVGLFLVIEIYDNVLKQKIIKFKLEIKLNFSTCTSYMENITWRRGDMNFLFYCKQVKYFSTQEEKFWTSKGPCNVLLILLYKHRWNSKPFYFIIFCCERHNLLCSRSKGDLFPCKDNMLFSCVCTKVHMVNLHFLSPLMSVHCC